MYWPAFLILLLLTFGFHAVHSNPQVTDPKLLLLAENIKKRDLENTPLEFLKELERTYSTRCAQATRSFECRINECDLRIAHCRKDHQLLFRGETGLFPYPGTSALMRKTLAPSKLCHSDCTYEKVSSSLARLFDKMKFWREADEVFVLDQDLSWKVASRTHLNEALAAGVPIGSLRTAATDDETFSPFQWLATNHFFISDLYMNEDAGPPTVIDPLVSYSPNPFVADHFASLVPQTQGRVIVLSVPRAKIINFCRRDQHSNLISRKLWPQRDEMGKFQLCDRNHESFGEELEIDAFLFTNPDYVFRTILTGKTSEGRGR